MRARTTISLTTAALLWAATWLIPGAALATQKCLCNNGEVVQSMDDAEDACEDACSIFGGGQRWDPRLDDDDDDDNLNRRRAVERERAPARSQH